MDAATIWSLRKPITWLWRKLVNLMGAWTVEPIFRQAHDYHIALRQWQQRWVELARDVEYKWRSRSSFDDEGNAEQSILIRNSGLVMVDEIHFCVEAKLRSFSYQVPLVAYRLQPGCTTRLPLPGLPLEDLIAHKNCVFPTYEAMHIYPIRIRRDSQDEIYSTDGIAWHPTHDDYLNGEWVRWKGRLYNINAIADCRRDCFLRLAYSLCWRHNLLGTDFLTLLERALHSGRYRRLPGVLVFALLSNDLILTAILWARLLLRVERIAFECDPATTAATEYVLMKGDGARPVRVYPIA